MKTALGGLLCVTGLCLLFVSPAVAQDGPLPTSMSPQRLRYPLSPSETSQESSRRFRMPGKRVSQYSAEDWGAWIDSTWGPGQTAAQQLNVFDTFWDRVNTSWGGFPNLSLNWDSIRTLYRPQIGSGLSRGRFAAVMSRVWMPLMEHHAYIYEYAVDKSFGNDNITSHQNLSKGSSSSPRERSFVASRQ